MAVLPAKLARLDELLRKCESYAPTGPRKTVRPFPEDAERLKADIIDLLLEVGPAVADIREVISSISFVKMGRIASQEENLAELDVPEEEQEYRALQEEARNLVPEGEEDDWDAEHAHYPIARPLERVADEQAIRRAARLLETVQERLQPATQELQPDSRNTTEPAGITHQLPTNHRKRGPPPDLKNQRKVVNLVKKYGDGWRNKLDEICAELDKLPVPVPKAWKSWKPKPGKTWQRALKERQRLVVQAIEYRLKTVLNSTTV